MNNFLVIPLFLRTNNKRKIDPRNVLIPTSESGLISDVLIIRGIVPQEIAKRLIKKYALSFRFKLTAVLVLSNY